MKHIFNFLDKAEDKARSFLSRFPVFYAVISGVAVVSFWRGVWETSDLMGVHPVASLIFGFLVLLSVGIFVTEFIGNRIIISGLKGEKKLEEKTLDEIRDEDKSLHEINARIGHIEQMLKELTGKK